MAPPVQKFFSKIAKERLQYRLVLLFLAFSMFLASVQAIFKPSNCKNPWGLHPQTPTESLPYTSAMQQCHAVPYPLQVSSRIATGSQSLS